MFGFTVNKERCTGCGECVVECPAGIIVMKGVPSRTEEEKCSHCQHCLSVCPTGALSIFGYDPDISTELRDNIAAYDTLATLVKGRRTIRRYKQHDVSAEVIDTLLNDAWHAPTAMNLQDVHFTVIREKRLMDRFRNEVMERLAAAIQSDSAADSLGAQLNAQAVMAWKNDGTDIIFRGAPHLLLATAPKSAPYPVEDCIIALTTFQLLAHAQGLGTVWDGRFMMALDACPDLVKKLGIPEEHVIGYAMAFGEPDVRYYRTVQRGPAHIRYIERI